MPQQTIYSDTGITGTVESQVFQIPPGKARGTATITLSTGPSQSNIFDMTVKLLQSEDQVVWAVRDYSTVLREIGQINAVAMVSSCALEGLEEYYLKVQVSVGQATVNVTVVVDI